MKYWPILLMLFTASSFAQIPGLSTTDNSISWTDEGGWMQVQDANTFESISACEGRTSSCSVSPGTYIVINHSSNERQDNVVVSAATTPQGGSITRAAQSCTNNFVGQDDCLVSCPSETSMIGVTTCSARLRNASGVSGLELPTSFSRVSGTLPDGQTINQFRCLADGNLYPDEDAASMSITVEIACQ